MKIFKRFKKAQLQPTEEAVPPPPPDLEEDAVSGYVNQSMKMLWVIEVFDPELAEPENFEELVAHPPMLYGPHFDPIEAMEVLDMLLENLNAAAEGFQGRVRPLFCPEHQS
jgi:hypothetical protein